MDRKLKRSLKSRHITMIAIGGAIGTGLFLGSGSAIQAAGPAIIFSYLLVGIITFLMMRALGELILSNPDNPSFIVSVRKLLGPRMEFVVGWTYWACWLSLAMADLTATGIYLKFWLPWLPQWVGPLVILVLLLLINMVDVGLFGELESWFSLIKVAAIVALIIAGVIMLLLGLHVGHNTVSLANLTAHGGLFPTGAAGFLRSFQMVVFAFVGIEIVGLTAGETAHPQKDIPRAINTLPLRIGLFYIGSMLAIMVVFPWNQIKTGSSPFVQVFSGIGIPAAAGILNFVVLTAAVSATNSAIFSTSRSLFALARGENAPASFGRLNKKAVPSRALLFSTFILFLIVVLNYLMPARVFDLVSTISTINFIMVWLIIMWAHYCYRERGGLSASFAMPGYPLTSWLTIAFYFLVLVILLWLPETRLALILSLVFMCALVLGFGLVHGKETTG